jgi:hypothetical protein
VGVLVVRRKRTRPRELTTAKPEFEPFCAPLYKIRCQRRISPLDTIQTRMGFELPNDGSLNCDCGIRAIYYDDL